MAFYNRWAFRQLYSTLDNHISDENCYADNGLDFRSIHGTLVHLLLSSKLWYNRLTATISHSIQDEKYPMKLILIGLVQQMNGNTQSPIVKIFMRKFSSNVLDGLIIQKK
ncbi:unnamed protein product [Rotaria magnacalcarata]|uniref:Uncharacterized protein n=2 Tax=Rotaria magnacalcarata TaxID=392030 RepID=A0A815H794_9BILA|nr:unnamed protein product [Rotaria magnacalcarata]CAF1348193.1 unnamed protein product [Rotaria magnacalcarata]CAF5074135.1 unnamed protein product [Rotaria magnacalcarata]CAF5110670.1 unnamed protein product [Rotaria magnacalcarata]